jgi:hypothetical protein
MKHEKSTLRIGSHLAMAVVLTFLGATLAAGQTQTVLYRFEGGTDSGDPAAGLVSDKAGNLYGTTEAFQIGCGTVFELVRPTSPGSQWIEEVIYAFYCENDGTPEDALIIDQAGNLYGTTYHNGLGSVFELSPPATQGGRVDRDSFAFFYSKEWGWRRIGGQPGNGQRWQSLRHDREGRIGTRLRNSL